ncbi:NTP transferase domain-containing protein [bacterium]|nr:NTP transferase domain-containing protein [bacterium]
MREPRGSENPAAENPGAETPAAETPLHLVVLAGGQSTRARRSDTTAPKQFRDAGRGMLFLHAIRELIQAPGVRLVVVVVPEPWRPTAERGLAGADLGVPWTLATAGAHRTASAWSALRALAHMPEDARPREHDLVAIHDAARPFASRHLLARLARVASRRQAAIPAVPVADTIVQIAPGETGSLEERPVASYLAREELAAVQTPQVARWADLHAAHAWAAAEGRSFTDDGGLLAVRGVPPVVVMGEAGNWKITTEQDWQRAADQLRRRSEV